MKAQLDGTINVDYGRVIDFLTHDIAHHIAHHVNRGIPWYHLKEANKALEEHFPHRFTKCEVFSLRTMPVFFAATSLRDPQTILDGFDLMNLQNCKEAFATVKN